LIFERHEFEEEQRSRDKEIGGRTMEPQKNNTLPCPPSEHNAQAPQIPTVPVARKRVFPKGREEGLAAAVVPKPTVRGTIAP
jgi:hypothetical protein